MPKIKSSRPLLKRPWLLATIGGATALGLLSMCQQDEAPAPQPAAPPAASGPPEPVVNIMYFNVVNDVPLAYGRTLKARSCVEVFAEDVDAPGNELSVRIYTVPTDTAAGLSIEMIVERSNLTNGRLRPSNTSACNATVELPTPQQQPQ